MRREPEGDGIGPPGGTGGTGETEGGTTGPDEPRQLTEPKVKPTVGIDKGILVCPWCFSRCVTATVEKRKKLFWYWWCGCGWAGERHQEVVTHSAVLHRFDEWYKTNGWPGALV